MTTSAWVLESRPPLLEALEGELSGVSNAVPWRIWNRALGEPLREFLGRPGKEFRGELTKIFFRIGGKKDSPPANLPLVVEALHAGSLIVDDVEDESSERRGRPALHLIHGMPLAINAGNWLYFWASALLDEMEMPADTRARASYLTTRALLDCHYGQALDLSVSVSDLAQSEVAGVVRAATELKTGSLLGLAAGLGALVGGAHEDVVLASVRFGRELGTGLQMLDDLSGIASPRRKHKGHEDLAHDRPSWPWAWLAGALSAADYERLRARGQEVRDGGDPAPLAEDLRNLLMPHAKRRVHEHLDAAHGELAASVPACPALGTLRREIDRLEKSYV
jgi:geranylgeranyl pyrophosphate synthase